MLDWYWVCIIWYILMGFISWIGFWCCPFWVYSILTGTTGSQIITLLGQSAFLVFLYLIFALMLLVIFFGFFWLISDIMPLIGVYKKLNTEDPLNGETLSRKIIVYFVINSVLSVFLLSVVFYFLYPSAAVPDSNLVANVSNISAVNYTQPQITWSDIIYILTMETVPGYLLATRLLANPTKNIFDFFVFKRYCSTPTEKREFIKNFKNMIISFNIALIIGAILYLFFKLLGAAANNQLTEEYNKYSFHLGVPALVLLLFIYFATLLITTSIGEIILSKFLPCERV